MRLLVKVGAQDDQGLAVFVTVSPQTVLCPMAGKLTPSSHEPQGSTLTFELNSQMASTCSGFTSHKRVSTGLGTSIQLKIKKNPVVIKP